MIDGRNGTESLEMEEIRSKTASSERKSGSVEVFLLLEVNRMTERSCLLLHPCRGREPVSVLAVLPGALRKSK